MNKARNWAIFAWQFWRKGGRDDVLCDDKLASEEIVDFVRVCVDGDQLGHRLAAFSDHDGFALGLNLVHHCKTICLKGARCHLLHGGP
jgi:hypothetical protein